jgi:hypothetical protein
MKCLTQVNAMAETMKKVQKQTKTLLANQQQKSSSTAGQLDSMSGKLAELEAMFAALLEMCRRRQALLEDSLAFYQLVQDLQEEAQWVDEKTAICAAPIQVGILSSPPCRRVTDTSRHHCVVSRYLFFLSLFFADVAFHISFFHICSILKSSSLEIYFTTVSAVCVKFELSCMRVLYIESSDFNIPFFT